MKRYKYIVFDFDGTIVDSRAVFISLYNELAVKHGYSSMAKDNLQQLRDMSIAQRCKTLNVPMYSIPFIAATIVKKYKNALPLLQFNEGMKHVLSSLAGGNVPFAILSSNSKANIDLFFKLQNIRNTEVFSSRSIFGKHVLINKFLKSKKLKPSEILYVGDELRDVIACHKSGVSVAWVSWGYDSFLSLAENRPDHVIDQPHEILALVKG